MSDPAPSPAAAPILVVNDRDDQLLAMSTMLEPLGHQVVTANSGEDALRKLLKREFAVMLLDVNMPGMDGFEIAEAMRSRQRTELTPIIFVTATNHNQLDRMRGYESGAFDYVTVPTDPAILRAKVAAFVRMHAMNAEIRRQADDLARLNLELGEQARRLAALNGELEAFSYSVSHDLRGPLRRIDQFSAVLADEHAAHLPDDARHLIARIRDNTGHMGRLIEDLLTLSHLNRTALSPSVVDVTALAEEILAELRQQQPQRRVEAVVAPGLTVRGDPGLVRVLLENLIGNAWKYTGRREVARIEVGITTHARHPRALFVRDNGAGFDMAAAGKLFAPFQRLHPAEQFTGSGIGLSIVARIVNRHGGLLWAEAAVDRGATFFVALDDGREPATSP
jgi:signal transduction histidine kinase